jgi:hypothetical protein
MKTILPPTRYNLLVKNRPGELMKLTKCLADAGMNLNSLRVANLGDRAYISFSTPHECELPASLKKSRIG